MITCVADLQYNNLKLQEENNKLKLTLEAVDETNNKLLADNENLCQQIKRWETLAPSVLLCSVMWVDLYFYQVVQPCFVLAASLVLLASNFLGFILCL